MVLNARQYAYSALACQQLTGIPSGMAPVVAAGRDRFLFFANPSKACLFRLDRVAALALY
jgi:hypothetical protein